MWISAEQAERAQPKHQFDEEILGLFEELKDALDEVYPQTIEGWEDGFARDANPEREIAVWLFMASLYQEFVKPRNLSLPAKKEVFALLLSVMNNGHEHALRGVSLSALSQAEAQDILALIPRSAS